MQFTSETFTSIFKSNYIQISVDGKDAWRDNVYVERLWRSVKYEEVYLTAYESIKEAKERIGQWIKYNNQQRKHQTLGCTTDMMYGNPNSLEMVA